MSSPMTQEQRYIKMTETPISRLIPSLAVPTIISMLVTSIYNMADTFFVSQISTSASAAVGVSYSLMSMIQALGFTLEWEVETIYRESSEAGIRKKRSGSPPRGFTPQFLWDFCLR